MKIIKRKPIKTQEEWKTNKRPKKKNKKPIKTQEEEWKNNKRHKKKKNTKRCKKISE